MTASDLRPDNVYVWTWLPGETGPVVVGEVQQRGGRFVFSYADSYLRRSDAVSLYEPEVCLQHSGIERLEGLALPGALRDGSPDFWGRHVIETTRGVDYSAISELGYLLASGSNRFGALDFQASKTEYIPRRTVAPLDELTHAASLLQQKQPLSDSLGAALVHGTTIGGARPKVLFDRGDEHWIAKLPSPSDASFSVIGAEAVAMRLARAAGLDVADTEIAVSNGQEVLLVRRFDRGPGGVRHHTVSGLTIAGEDEMYARYVTYPMLLDMLRQRGADPASVGQELFRRIAYSIAISNSDDHARNHTAFWDGRRLTLTPAYDLTPGPRSGETATQAMAYNREGTKISNFAVLLTSAPIYDLSQRQGRHIIEKVIAAINDGWEDAADAARLSVDDCSLLWGHQFLNPAALYDF